MNNGDIEEWKDNLDDWNRKIDSMQSDIKTIKGFSKFVFYVICFLIGWKMREIIVLGMF